MSARAMVQTAPCRLELRELPLPEIDDESALLHVEACGICGSDIEQYRCAVPLPVPAIPGHEPLGVIERIGDRAARRWGVDWVWPRRPACCWPRRAPASACRSWCLACSRPW